MSLLKKIGVAVVALILLIGVFAVRSQQNTRNQSENLFKAAFAGNAGEVKHLLDQGIPVDEVNIDSELTPLMAAADRGHADIVELLVSHGANIETQSKNGLTPLMLAANRDRVQVVRLLISKGVDVRKKNVLGRTALDMAVSVQKLPSNQQSYRFEETIRLLQQVSK